MKPGASLACALVAVLFAGVARAQDFASAAPWDVRGGDALLESALPGRSATPGLALAVSRWLALPELETRSVALTGGWRSLRAAVGAAQTGDLELGYSAAGAALFILAASARAYPLFLGALFVMACGQCVLEVGAMVAAAHQFAPRAGRAVAVAQQHEAASVRARHDAAGVLRG